MRAPQQAHGRRGRSLVRHGNRADVSYITYTSVIDVPTAPAIVSGHVTGRHNVDMITGVMLFIVVAVVAVAGFYVVKPEK